MNRKWKFLPPTKAEARLRQKGRCAHCGDSLNEQWEEAHHVIPDQVGENIPENVWMKSALNCVVLCDPCHINVGHDGNTRIGTIGDPEIYKHSHGNKNSIDHAEWVRALNVESAKVWGNAIGQKSKKG